MTETVAAEETLGAESDALRVLGDNAMSKTEASQQIKGTQSYYYWHGDAERRRLTGEQPVPLPTPQKIMVTHEQPKEKRVKPISTFSFMDDGDLVKVYIPLEAELAGVSMEQVEVEFADRALLATIELPDCIHRFSVEPLAHTVDTARCKSSITKSGKLVLKLYKRNPLDRWAKLRSS